ncbi:MAG: TIGR04283 family arsenosugar biosynthesis glycosyltransferase [Boseongicola sp.]|nr:TIGR04283 family arsenosugar biosynthesis glycosyltransferase [Boseongicola sp.]MDD9977360.1 TIGR04283 family arsenosugar biosynthesis glycosyltransferase [Boseongicola sp.]
MPAPVDVIIPTLNAADALPDCAEALLPGVTSGLIGNLIVSDGGSTDGTQNIAKELGAIVIEGKPSRGGQIRQGVERSNAPWVLIVHADTELSPTWVEAVQRHRESNPNQAGFFRLAFSSSGMAAAIVAGGANLRSNWLKLPYGDQGLFVSRSLLDDVGGVPDVPLMEDVMLAKALKGRMRMLDATATTSAMKYERDGWVRRVVRNLTTLLRFKLGVSPDQLAQTYDRRSQSSEN